MNICEPPVEDRRHARRQATREAILAAAEDLVLAHGYEGLRTKDLVERAGVSERTVFNHFENLEAILLARIEDYLRPLMLEPEFPTGLQVRDLPSATVQRFRDAVASDAGQEHFAGFIRLAAALVSMGDGILARQVLLTLLDLSKHLVLDIESKYPLTMDESLSLHLFASHLTMGLGLGLARGINQDAGRMEQMSVPERLPDVADLVPHLNWGFDRATEGMPRF